MLPFGLRIRIIHTEHLLTSDISIIDIGQFNNNMNIVLRHWKEMWPASSIKSREQVGALSIGLSISAIKGDIDLKNQDLYTGDFIRL